MRLDGVGGVIRGARGHGSAGERLLDARGDLGPVEVLARATRA